MRESKKNICKKMCVCMAFVLMFVTIFSVLEFSQSEHIWAAEKVRISKSSLNMEVGKSTTLKVIGTKKKAKWSSSNKSVATVSLNGKVKAKKVGKATITAKIGKKSYKCKVTVKKASKNTAKVGFYVGGSDNSRRVAVQEISGNKVKFVLFYSAMSESLSEPIVGTIKDGKVEFTYKSDWGNSGTGIIVFNAKNIELKTDGYDLLSTDNKTIKLKWVNDNPDVMQIY